MCIDLRALPTTLQHHTNVDCKHFIVGCPNSDFTFTDFVLANFDARFSFFRYGITWMQFGQFIEIR